MNIDTMILTCEEAAEYLHISRGHLYKLVMNRKIPYHKPTGKLYFTKNEIDEWILGDGKSK